VKVLSNQRLHQTVAFKPNVRVCRGHVSVLRNIDLWTPSLVARR